MSCCQRGLDGGDPYGIEVTLPSKDDKGSEVRARLSSVLTSIERLVGERVSSAMTGDGDGAGGGDGCEGFAVDSVDFRWLARARGTLRQKRGLERRSRDQDRADVAHHRHSKRPVGLLHRLRRLQPDASRRMPPGDRFARGDVHRDEGERGRGMVGRVPRRAGGLADLGNGFEYTAWSSWRQPTGNRGTHTT